MAERLLYLHGITFGGHPVAAAVALKNLEIMEREDVLGNVQRNEGYFHDQLVGLMDRHEIIGDVRGAGYFKSIELVKDKDTRETFTCEECNVLLRGFLSPALFKRGPDLPRRRPRRPGDPALAAADLHARAHRRGDRRSSTTCSPRART